MGGESKKQEQFNQNSRTAPWEVTAEPLERVASGVKTQLETAGLSPVEQAAYSDLESNARGGNPYAPSIGLLATDMLNGGKDRSGMATQAYDEFRGGLLPYAKADSDPYQNPAFTKAVGFMSDDILDRVKSSYAGAGYSPAGAGDFGKSVGEGIARGIAPTWAQARNDLESRKLGAINNLYGAGNTTAGLLSGLDQAEFANRRAGIDVARSALLAKDSPAARLLELQQGMWATPMQRLAAANDAIVPMAKAFGTTNTEGERNTTAEMSPAEQAWGWMNAFGNLGRSFGGGGRGGGGGWGSA